MSDITKKLHPINDAYLKSVKQEWFSKQHPNPSREEFIEQATTWFKSTKLNQLHGWNAFPYHDIIIGCTNYIESTCLRYSWKIQHLPNEYAYYSVMGKQPTPVGELKENIPLIISLPVWQHCDIHENWEEILKECEQKNIDIHIDGAWFQSARDINFNFDHPNIKSFAMSMTKGLELNWNRVGIRWSKQRTMDSITLLNNKNTYGENITACGSFLMSKIEKDYAWNTYKEEHIRLAKEHNLLPTNSIHVLRDNNNVYGIGKILSKIKKEDYHYTGWLNI